MSALASTNQESTSDSVAQISVIARVDYILRFSKQAVIVIDELTEHYSAVGSQFLGSIPNHHNAAYLSVSPKLNDIQIRARIVEQLFFDQAFDPEQSIAVSLINLVKSFPQSISIVIEHGQFLSLQLVHELCQLAEIAKKSNLEINVLILGDLRLGATLYENQSLFTKKVSVLDAQSGQLLGINSKRFKPQVALFSWTINKTLIFSLSILVMVLIGTVWLLSLRDVTAFSGLETASPVSTSDDSALAIDNVTAEAAIETTEQAPKIANIHDIYLALINEQNKPLQAEQDIQLADVSDVLVAIQAREVASSAVTQPSIALEQHGLENQSKEQNVKHELTAVEAGSANLVTEAMLENSAVMSKTSSQTTAQMSEQPKDIDYFAKFNDGYAIQLAGFRQEKVKDDFIAEFGATIDIYAYQRLQSGKPYWVVTSKVYATREQAVKNIGLLPGMLKARSPWIKSVMAIQKEKVTYSGDKDGAHLPR